jgi:hypothetical protein
VPEPLVPSPGDVANMCSEAHRGDNIHVEVVEAAWRSVHLGEQESMRVEDAEDAFLDDDLEAVLVHLPEAHYVGGEPRDEVDFAESAVLAGSEGEEHGALPFDVDHRPITKFHSAGHAAIELGEDVTRARHMVRRAGVENPSAGSLCLLLFLSEVEEDLRLDEVDSRRRIDGAQWRRRRWGVRRSYL